MSIKYLTVIGHLLKRDLISWRKDFLGKLFDTALMLFTNVAVFAYFMPAYGLRADYGPFYLIGAIASFGFFDTVGKVHLMMSDLEGDLTISYLLTLPVPSIYILLYHALWWAISTALIGVLMFPLGKLFLWTQFNVHAISYWRLILMFCTACIFYGIFSLWLTSIFEKMTDIGHLWVRVIIPLYSFGAFFFPWDIFYSFSPILGVITLINPLIFVAEGMRSACLGPGPFLPFFVSFFALWGFILWMGRQAISRLKKRLDCV